MLLVSVVWACVCGAVEDLQGRCVCVWGGAVEDLQCVCGCVWGSGGPAGWAGGRGDRPVKEQELLACGCGCDCVCVWRGGYVCVWRGGGGRGAVEKGRLSNKTWRWAARRVSHFAPPPRPLTRPPTHASSLGSHGPLPVPPPCPLTHPSLLDWLQWLCLEDGHLDARLILVRLLSHLELEQQLLELGILKYSTHT